MKAKISLFTLLVLTLILSCSKDETQTPTFQGCKLLKYGKVVSADAGNIPSETIGYLRHYIYNNNNVLSKEINFGFRSLTGSGHKIFDEIIRDSLVYDKRNRLDKIYHKPKKHTGYNYFSEFLYKTSNSSKPYKRLEHRLNYDNTLFRTYEESIYYSENKISRTEMHYVALDNKDVTVSKISRYKYDERGNLIEIHKSESRGEYLREEITKYSKYDDKKNPFKNIPTLDYRGISDSNNYYSEYEITTYNKGELDSAESGKHKREYNSYGYPEIGIYECN